MKPPFNVNRSRDWQDVYGVQMGGCGVLILDVTTMKILKERNLEMMFTFMRCRARPIASPVSERAREEKTETT